MLPNVVLMNGPNHGQTYYIPDLRDIIYTAKSNPRANFADPSFYPELEVEQSYFTKSIYRRTDLSNYLEQTIYKFGGSDAL